MYPRLYMRSALQFEMHRGVIFVQLAEPEILDSEDINTMSSYPRMTQREWSTILREFGILLSSEIN